MERTSEEILEIGLEALRQRLGRAGMIRFIQHFDSGKGDYAKERHKLVDRLSMSDLTRRLVEHRKSRRASKRKRRSRSA